MKKFYYNQADFKGTIVIYFELNGTDCTSLEKALDELIQQTKDMDHFSAYLPTDDNTWEYAIWYVLRFNLPDKVINERTFFETCSKYPNLHEKIAQYIKNVNRLTDEEILNEEEPIENTDNEWQDEMHPNGSYAIVPLVLQNPDYARLFGRLFGYWDMEGETYQGIVTSMIFQKLGITSQTLPLLVLRTISDGQSIDYEIEAILWKYKLRDQIDLENFTEICISECKRNPELLSSIDLSLTTFANIYDNNESDYNRTCEVFTNAILSEKHCFDLSYEIEGQIGKEDGFYGEDNTYNDEKYDGKDWGDEYDWDFDWDKEHYDEEFHQAMDDKKNLTKSRKSKTTKNEMQTPGHSRFLYRLIVDPKSEEETDYITFSPDLSKLVIANFDGKTFYWDLATGKKIKEIEGLFRRIKHIDFLADGSKLLVKDISHEINFYDSESGEFLFYLDDIHNSFDCHPINPTFASGGYKGELILYSNMSFDFDSYEVHSNKVQEIIYSPNGEYLASLCESYFRIGFQQMITKRSGLFSRAKSTLELFTRRLRTIKQDSDIHEITFSPNSELVAAYEEPILRVWNCSDGQLVAKIKQPVLNCCFFSADSLSMYLGLDPEFDDDNGLVVWDIKSNKIIRVLEEYKSSWNLVVSPDGRLLALPQYKNLILISLPDYKTLDILKGHKGHIDKIVFSKNGHLLASSDYNIVHVWDLKDLV